MKLRYYKILEKTKVEGPGERFCVWVQGCSKHCAGCWAKETWDFNAGNEITTRELLQKIFKTKGLEGITFLGGEPFEQAKALSIIACNVKRMGLSVLTFTGCNYEELLSRNDKYVQKLIQNTDLLIDGGFEQENYDLSRPWVGSLNQRYIFLSSRYSADIVTKYKNKIEVRIDSAGDFCINGMGDFSKIKKIMLDKFM